MKKLGIYLCCVGVLLSAVSPVILALDKGDYFELGSWAPGYSCVGTGGMWVINGNRLIGDEEEMALVIEYTNGSCFLDYDSFLDAKLVAVPGDADVVVLDDDGTDTQVSVFTGTSPNLTFVEYLWDT